MRSRQGDPGGFFSFAGWAESSFHARYDSPETREPGTSERETINQISQGGATSMADPEATESTPPPPKRVLEAFLFIGGAPLTAERAAQAIRGLSEAQFLEAIAELNHEYRQQGRPYGIQAREQGHVLVLRPRFRPVLEKLYGGTREARLSTAAVDVLALVAYRQPATKQEIDNLRGFDSGSLLRQLVRRGLITIVHRAEADRREVAYGTTPRFLQLFGLRSLDDLPQTQDLQRL
jgi:segregation and condensation protein B